jgi:hypothetical protein
MACFVQIKVGFSIISVCTYLTDSRRNNNHVRHQKALHARQTADYRRCAQRTRRQSAKCRLEHSSCFPLIPASSCSKYHVIM